jgi:hypothetical protein
MSLIITFMFEPAKLQMNWASASGSRILRSDPAGRPAVATSVMPLIQVRPAMPGGRDR